jgi:hypothetical protein
MGTQSRPMTMRLRPHQLGQMVFVEPHEVIQAFAWACQYPAFSVVVPVEHPRPGLVDLNRSVVNQCCPAAPGTVPRRRGEWKVEASPTVVVSHRAPWPRASGSETAGRGTDGDDAIPTSPGFVPRLPGGPIPTATAASAPRARSAESVDPFFSPLRSADTRANDCDYRQGE